MKNKAISQELARLLEIDVNTIEDDFKLAGHGGWDSLAIVSLIATIDQAFGVIVKGCEIEKCLTVKEIFNLIDSKTIKASA